MNRVKIADFFFTKPYEKVINEVNREFPINLTNNELLVNKVHAKYQLVDKSDIALVIQTFFETWRELLLSNKIVNIGNIIFHNRLNFVKAKRSGKDLIRLQVRTVAPLALAKMDYIDDK